MKNKSKLDQHFLKDKSIIKEIINASELKFDDVVVEIGPGKGIITKELSKRAKRVIAIELDKNFKPYLDKLPNNVKIIYGNALELITNLKFNKIISNIPYSISEPLFKKLLKINLDTVVLITGKKFFELFSEKDSKWSIISKIFFDVKKVTDIPKEAFDPKPEVNSVILVLKKRKNKLTKLESLVKEFVLQDDKKVKNALMLSFMRVKNLTKKEAKGIVYNLDLPPELVEKNVNHLSNRLFRLIYGKLFTKID